MSQSQEAKLPPTEQLSGPRLMSLVHEKVIPDPPSSPLPPTPLARSTPTPPSVQREYIHRAAWKAGVLGSLNLAVSILAVRLILLLAVLGAVGLTWLALAARDLLLTVPVGLYTITVCLPLVWLAGRR